MVCACSFVTSQPLLITRLIMDAWGIAFMFIVKWGLVALVLFGIERMYAYRGDGKAHLATKICTVLAVFFALCIFIAEYLSDKDSVEKITGDYGLRMYKCDECIGCIVRFKKDKSYTVLKYNAQIGNGTWAEIDRGTWDFSVSMAEVFMEIDGKKHGVLDDTKTISGIKNDNCRHYWRIQNLQQSINGTVLSIDSTNNTYSGVYPFTYLDAATKNTISYEPKYVGHAWLNDVLSVGCFVSKEKDSSTFRITKPNGKVVVIPENW